MTMFPFSFFFSLAISSVTSPFKTVELFQSAFFSVEPTTVLRSRSSQRA
jgi:hypothetical protein